MRRKMKKVTSRILCLFLTFILVFGVIPTMALEVNAASSYTMNVNMDLLKQVGVQIDYTYTCSCYALAYCRTLLDQRVHHYYEYNKYGQNEYNVDCYWSWGNYTKKTASSEQSLLKDVYNYINANKPVIVYVQNHWIMLVGYQNVSNVNNLSLNNFLMVDSLGISSRNKTLAIQNTSARGYTLQRLSSGAYQYVVPNSGSVPTSYSVNTNIASNVSNYSATISGVLSSGSASYWGFDFGTNKNNLTAYNYTGSSCDVQKYTGELNAGTTYYYRMWAMVAGKKVSGDIKSFTTTMVQPNIPNVNITTKDVAIGDSISASWSATSNAQYYNAYLYDANNNLLQQKNVKGTSVAFEGVGVAGSYYIAVAAHNNAGTKGQSALQEVIVHPNVKVKFVDFDGKELCEEQEVGYGKSASAPAEPSRKGYTFTKWDGNYTNVKEDTTITATYTINTYTVRFFDNKGVEIGAPQKVTYGSGATAPEYTPEDGYKLFGWNKEFDFVEEDMDITANIDWYNENYSVFAKIDSAVRVAEVNKNENEGYEIDITITNNNDSTTRGRVVVALETEEGKLVTTTESSAFSVKAGSKKELNIFIPYDNYAKNVKVYTVSRYSDVVPIAEPVSATIDQSQPWSDWSTEEPPKDAYEVETRTEYRYKTKTTTTSYETSMSGWTQDGSQWVQTGSGIIHYVSSWPSSFHKGNWIYSNYNNTPPTAYENATQKRTVSTWNAGYVYWHWCRGDNAGTINRMISYNYTSTFYSFHAFIAGSALGYNSSADAFQCSYRDICNSTYWWNSANPNSIPLNASEYKDYRKLFNYYKWSEFSDWNSTAKIADTNTVVETRTVYRYRTNEMLQEDTSGVERTIEGNVGVENAGKMATLYVYKVDSASDYTNEYVGQSKIDEKGKYSFTFKLREEPTAETGDFTVALGIEGASTEIYLDSIEAPKKEYKVKFYDKGGTVISEQTVKEGEDATLPETEKMQLEGYRFINWKESNRNIREDLDIYPNYELEEYTVVFVDWTSRYISMEKFKHGDVLITPELGAVDEDQVISWDIEDGAVVTKDMIVTSKIEDKTVDVEIRGFNDEIIDEQTVKYGSAVNLPYMEGNEDYIFLGWKTKSNLESETVELNSALLLSNAVIYADYTYAETVASPYSNVAEGEYDKEQTIELTCETEGAEIYFTVDGTNPADSKTAIKYAEPFVLQKSCQLKFIAKCPGKNDSSEVCHFFAINTGVEKYHILKIVAAGGTEDVYLQSLVKDGFKINTDDFTDLIDGHSFGGFFKDTDMLQKFWTDTDTIQESVTLYAKYNPATYMVTFKDSDGTIVKSEAVAYGQVATAPEMEKTGYVFAGWDTDDYLFVEKDLTVIAQYVLTSEYATVSLNRSELAITEGYQYQLEATIMPKELTGKTLSWRSDDSNIATVVDGLVKGIAPGETVITVTVEETGETATCVVKIKPDEEKETDKDDTIIKGDGDGNGKVDANDALVILKIVAGMETIGDNVDVDVNKDGSLDANDALVVLKYVAGMISEL